MPRTLLYCALFSATMVAAGCGGPSSTYTDAQGNSATVERSGDQTDVTFRGAQGQEVKVSASEKGVPLPKELPKDVPIYPDAKVTTAMTHGPAGMSVVFAPQATVAEVSEFYEKQLVDQGWTLANTVRSTDGGMFNAKKDEKRMVTVMIGNNKKEGAATVTINVATPPANE